MKDVPQVEMKWDHWCGLHLHPLKKEWPKGAALAQVALFQASMSSPGIQILMGSGLSAQEAMDKSAPLCCMLGHHTAALIITKALKGIVHCCECNNHYPSVPCKLCEAMFEAVRMRMDKERADLKGRKK